MNRFVQGSLALIEALIALILARPAVLNALKIVFTRKAIFLPNWAYFAGMLFGDLVKVTIASLLIWHAVRITRKLISPPTAPI
jgi:hypothetical protein